MKNIYLTADAIIVKDKKILLVKRKNNPFKGMWALPGGFVNYGERVEDAVKREAKEETNLDVEDTKLIGVYSAPDRDPRGHTVTIAYSCETSNSQAKAADDAEEVKWWDLGELPEIAFDHALIVQDYKNLK